MILSGTSEIGQKYIIHSVDQPKPISQSHKKAEEKVCQKNTQTHTHTKNH